MPNTGIAPNSRASDTAKQSTSTVSPGQTLIISRPGDTSTITLQLSPPAPKSLADLSIYAPAVPGVLVALAGLLIAHWLTTRRDRRKEVADLCAEIKKAADEAATAAMSAWLLISGDERRAAIHDVKRRIQNLGIASTYIAGRTKGRINLSSNVAAFRKAATRDPFEDPEREGTEGQHGPIMADLAKFMGAVDAGFNARFR